MTKKLIEIASEIVQTQASCTSMTAAEISSALRQVFSTLHELQRAESGEIVLLKPQEPAPAKALSPEESIQSDKVICLECGAERRQLSRAHLASHGMSVKDYKAKYGFPMRTSLAAKAVSRARSKAAKKRGLPENLKKYMEARRQEKAEAAPKPITPENSIQEDKIICLECGAELKQLSQKHLAFHSLTPTKYKKKYGFSMETPLLAKSVYEAMKEARQKRGLPEDTKKAIEARREATKTGAESNKSETGRAKRVRNRFSPMKTR